MMSVRQRRWKSNGSIKTAWVAAWTDRHGKRRLQTFHHKHEAVDFHKVVSRDVRGVAIAMAFARQLPITRLQMIIAEKRKNTGHA